MVRDAPKIKGMALQLDAVIFFLVVAILLGAYLYRSSGMTTDSKVAQAKADLAVISVAINQYAFEMRKAPTDITVLSKSDKYDDVTYGPWLQKTSPKDPWGNFYQITQVTENDKKVGYIVYSYGPPPSTGTVTQKNFENSDFTQRIGSYTAKGGAIAYYGRYGSPID